MTRLNYNRARKRYAGQIGGAAYTYDAARRVIYLRVPFDDRLKASRLGARWDAKVKRWFCLAGTTTASALFACFGMAEKAQA